MSEFDPKNDGVDHINIHSAAATELGRLLDNLASVPFSHPKYGEFKTVEGFYWYLVCGESVEDFRRLNGYEVRRHAKELANDPKHISGRCVHEASTATYLKVTQNPHLKKLLRESDLPLTCYVLYGTTNSKILNGKAHQNHVTMLQVLRDQLKLERN